MAGPWDKYAGTSQDSGPWAKYAQQPADYAAQAPPLQPQFVTPQKNTIGQIYGLGKGLAETLASNNPINSAMGFVGGGGLVPEAANQDTHPLSYYLHDASVDNAAQNITNSVKSLAPQGGTTEEKIGSGIGTGFLALQAIRGAGKSLPSRAVASNTFQEVSQAAGGIPVDVSSAGNVALRINDIANSGATMPKVIRDFIKRATDPAKGPITYDEARDFYSNATSKLSAEEAAKLTPKMKFQLSQFARALDGGIQEAANAGGITSATQFNTARGVGARYRQAMQEFAAASRNARSAEVAGDLAKKTATVAIPGLATAYAAKKIIDAR